MAEYIYSMVRARKKVGDKLILDDVTMAFLPGAKIGMVGPNGAGKSTILKIMAGLDTPSISSAMRCGRGLSSRGTCFLQTAESRSRGSPSATMASHSLRFR